MPTPFRLGRAAPLLLVLACRTTAPPAAVARTPEHVVAARVAGCYGLRFDTTGARDRLNLAAHSYVELTAPAPRFTYGQLPARPTLDSAITDYPRPAWVPLPPDSVVVFWRHAWSLTSTLEARLGESGDSLAGYIGVATDVVARPAVARRTRVVARRIQCRSGLSAPGT